MEKLNKETKLSGPELSKLKTTNIKIEYSFVVDKSELTLKLP